MYKDFDMNYLKELAGLLNLKLDKKISTFSKGMKRQCALICAISTNCDYMFLMRLLMDLIQLLEIL